VAQKVGKPDLYHTGRYADCNICSAFIVCKVNRVTTDLDFSAQEIHLMIFDNVRQRYFFKTLSASHRTVCVGLNT